LVTNTTDSLDLDNFTTTEYDFVNTYAIKPNIFGYEYINITTTAVTGDAFICDAWNFTTRSCPDNKWRSIGEFDPGQNYSYIYYGTTPVGFMESNLTINLIDAYGYFIPNNQTRIHQDGTVVDMLLKPKGGNIVNITVYSHNSINRSNELQIGGFENFTGWPYNLLINPTGLNFINATMNINATANGVALVKCLNYSFEEAICKNNFTTVLNLTPGQVYTLIVNSTDPVYFEQPNDSAGVDTFIDEAASGNNYGTNTQMRVDNRNNGRNMRGMIQWNLSSIPTGVTITNATMSLYLNQSNGNAITITAVRITSSWNETNVTWATKPGYNTTIYDSKSVDTTGIFYDWNITTAVQEWYNGTYPNYGMYLKVDTENSTGNLQSKIFLTSDYSVSTLRPKINITYGDITAPTVTLVAPAPNFYNDTANPASVLFNCSATDNVNLSNISLYITNSQNTSFGLNITTNIAGTSSWANWTLSLANGNYTWNCRAFDTSGNSAYATTNRTVKINYTAFVPVIGFSVTLPGQSPVNASTGGNVTAEMTFNSSSNTYYGMSPCVGSSSNCQNSTVPFFIYYNTGNLNLNLSVSLNASLPSVFRLSANTVYNNNTANTVNTSPLVLGTNLVPAATLNAFFFGDFINAYPANGTYRNLTSTGVQS